MEASFPSSSFLLNQHLYSSILHRAPFGYSLMNAAYVIEHTNETWLKIVGKRQEEVVGKSIFHVFPEAVEQLSTIFSEENPRDTSSAEHRLKIKRSGDAGAVYFNLVYQSIYDVAGDFQYYSIVIIDITHLVKIKNKVKEEAERLRLATESSCTGTWDLNLKTHALVYSPSLAKIFGYNEQDMVTHTQLRSHLMEEDRINVVDKAFEAAIKTGIYRYEAQITDCFGNQKWIFTNGKIFYDEEGLPDRMLGIMQDVTERKQSEIRQLQSHHELNTAIEATKLGLFEMNPETLEKSNFSPRFLEILGYDPKTETVDTHVLERHIHPDFVHIRTQALQKARETGDLHYQTKVILRDGSTKWIELYGRLLSSQKGSHAYISGTIRDITDLKDYEEKISESERKYRFLADVMPQIVWIREADGQMTYVNKSTLIFTGRPYENITKTDAWAEIIHPEDKDESQRLWEKSITELKPFFCEHRFRNAAGDYRWFMSRAYPEVDENGVVTKWVGTSTDIDEMKRQERQKNDFIKMANHELKTPVTTIKGYVQLLKKMRGNSEDQFLVNSLGTIENQVNKLNALIGDLLDISRMESGNLPLNTSEISIVKLVTETIEDIKASEQSHDIIFSLRHAGDIEVTADKDRLTQVLNNLLTNAIKYSPQANKVHVALYVEDGQAIVSVEDFGIGMDKEELGKIFHRFYRVSGDDEKTFPGFGIGLYIVKDILKRHGGKIWVESEKNSGSKFFFSLPVSQKI